MMKVLIKKYFCKIYTLVNIIIPIKTFNFIYIYIYIYVLFYEIICNVIYIDKRNGIKLKQD